MFKVGEVDWWQSGGFPNSWFIIVFISDGGGKVYIASIFNNNEMQLFYQGNM